ncbi:MAG: hypothetical protein RR623_09580 [Bacilli bacterium]
MIDEEKLAIQGFLIEKKEYEQSKLHIPISCINKQIEEHVDKMNKQFDEDVVLELSKTYNIKGTAQEIVEMISNLKKELQKSKADINNLKQMLEESYKTIDRQLDYIFKLKSSFAKNIGRQEMKGNFYSFLLSRYTEKYKLTKNEVTELKYMQLFGQIFSFNKSIDTWCLTANCKKFIFKYDYLDKTKTYSIEEILANYEVVE